MREVADLAPYLTSSCSWRSPLFQDFWEENVPDSWAREIVSLGYSLEIVHPLPTLSHSVRCTQGGVWRDAIMRVEIEEMLRKGAIEIVNGDFTGWCSWFQRKTQLSVSNLKPLNKHLKYTVYDGDA